MKRRKEFLVEIAFGSKRNLKTEIFDNTICTVHEIILLLGT